MFDVLDTFDQHEDICNYFTVAITITPLYAADKYYEADTDEEFCEGQKPLPNQL